MTREDKIQLMSMMADAFLTPAQQADAWVHLDDIYDQAATLDDDPAGSIQFDVTDPRVLQFMRICIFILRQGDVSEEEYVQ